jgi:hypothetical protein
LDWQQHIRLQQARQDSDFAGARLLRKGETVGQTDEKITMGA